MGNKDESVLYKKAFGFAIRIVRIYKYLIEEKKEYVMAKQLLKCGTSIGANIREALDAQSKKDFVAKLYIALKEAGETEYWIELLVATNYLNHNNSKTVLENLCEINRMLTSSIMTAKKNMEKIKSKEQRVARPCGLRFWFLISLLSTLYTLHY